MPSSPRHDRGSLAAPTSGTLFEGKVARTHGQADALEYADGPEYRDQSEVTSIASQLPGIPVTLGHPDGMIADGSPATIVGRVIAGRIDGDHAVASMMITEQAGLDAIASGQNQLSLGYICTLDSNRFQRGVKLDHLSIVPLARCGPTCSLRADSACGCSLDAKLNAKERHALPAGEFAAPAERGLPIENAGHVRAAMSRFGQEHFASSAEKKTAFHHILSKAKELGVDATGFEKEWSGRLDNADPDAITGPDYRHGACTCGALSHTGPEMTTAGAIVAPEPQDKILMDELQKQLATALGDAAQHKARADQAEKDRDAQKARADQSESDKTKAEVEAHNAKATLAAETARADKALADATAASLRADAAGADQALVDARVEVLTSAARVLPPTGADGVAISYSKMPNRDIKVAIIAHVDGMTIDATKPDAFVDGAYEGALDRHAKASGSVTGARAAIVQMRADQAPLPMTNRDAENTAKQAASQRQADAWKTKISSN